MKKILKEVLEEIKPQKKEVLKIRRELIAITSQMKREIKKNNISAEVFVGGSFAKGTMIKRNGMDIDIFIRFDKKYSEQEMKKLTKKIISFLKYKVVKGSRDYFKVKISDAILEIVPIRKIAKPEQAENVTDLSYFHVKYENKKLNNQLRDEIRLAKAFCHASGCYGAESYIRGFSGYGLELLLIYYQTFEKFVKEISSIKTKKFIDIEKKYRNEREALMSMNSSKLESPIILVDPVLKGRNALAALSHEKFIKFQKWCKKFLKKPSKKFFVEEKIDLDKLKEKAKESENKVFLIIKTNKQEGDIAGTKLLKFNEFLKRELSKKFEITKSFFEYSGKKEGFSFIEVRKKEKIIIEGPFKKDKKNLERFIKKHADVFFKNDRVYAIEIVEETVKEFLKSFIKNKKKIIKDMGITKIKIL